MKNIIVLAILSVIVSTSCRKKLDTVANIYIKDENNASVSNAMVVLYGTNTQGTPQQVAVFDTAYTNLNGMAIQITKKITSAKSKLRRPLMILLTP